MKTHFDIDKRELVESHVEVLYRAIEDSEEESKFGIETLAAYRSLAMFAFSRAKRQLYDYNSKLHDPLTDAIPDIFIAVGGKISWEHYSKKEVKFIVKVYEAHLGKRQKPKRAGVWNNRKKTRKQPLKRKLKLR
jgi:hypothetical protein